MSKISLPSTRLRSPVRLIVAESDRRPSDLGASAQNIARAASKQLTEDGVTEGAARRALERIAAGPYGAQAVQGTKALCDYLHRAATRIAELKACINDERKFLRASKGRRATLARLAARNERDRTLSTARRAELSIAAWRKANKLRHRSEVARAKIDDAGAEIRRIQCVRRDLLAAFLLGETLRYPGQRVPSDKDVRLAIEGFAASRLLPKTSLCKLRSLAKAEHTRPGGVALWPHTTQTLQNFFR